MGWKKGCEIYGWLIVDKFVGVGLIDVVGCVCWVLDVKKVGYVGMLDFDVMGVLVIVLGEVIKIVLILMDVLKVYDFWVNWGVQILIDDVLGQVIDIVDSCFDVDQICVVLGVFVGDIMQVLLNVLVVKVDGECVYDFVCDGEVLELVVCLFWVELLELLMVGCDSVDLCMVCGKGGYVCVIVCDLGCVFGCFGYVDYLCCIWFGLYEVVDGIVFDCIDCVNQVEIEVVLLLL